MTHGGHNFAHSTTAVQNWDLSLDYELIIETVSLEGTFCDTVQVPSGADDMQLI